MTDKGENAKKRKRSHDGSSKPSKRVAIEGDKQVKLTLHEADKWAPVIGTQLYLILKFVSGQFANFK